MSYRIFIGTQEFLKKEKDIKCVVVGDGNVGKSSMLVAFTTKKLPVDYVPTVFDNFKIPMKVNEVPATLDLWDTAGQEDYDRLRQLSYPQTDVFLLCFSVVNPSSFKNITTKWCIELKLHCPNTPIILVGTKIDLRENPETLSALAEQGLEPVTIEQAEKLVKKLNIYKYMECSALNQRGLKQIFQEAVRAHIWPEPPKPKRTRKCLLM